MGVKKEELTCPYCDGPLKLIVKAHEMDGILLHGTKMYFCTLCETKVFSTEQCEDIARRVKRTKEKKKRG